jgi:hypothetical protein
VIDVSIIRAMSHDLHGATPQKTAIFKPLLSSEATEIKLATAIFVETLDNSQHSTRLTTESRSYISSLFYCLLAAESIVFSFQRVEIKTMP